MIVTRSVKTRSLARRRVQSLSSVRVHDCKDKKLGALGAWALEQQGRVIDEWRSEAEALLSLVSRPWFTQYYFVDMLQARKIEQRVSTRSTSIFACSMHDIRARPRVIHSWSACRSVANVAARSESQKFIPAANTTNSNVYCCDRAAAQVKQHIPEQPGWKNSK